MKAEIKNKAEIKLWISKNSKIRNVTLTTNSNKFTFSTKTQAK